MWKCWRCWRFRQCRPSWSTTEEHARSVWWNETILPEQQWDSSCYPEGNPCLARNLSMASLNPVCVRNTLHYSRTESSLSEAKKTSSLLKEFLAQQWLWPSGTFFIQLFFTCRVLRGLCFNSCCCTCLDCFPLFQGHLLCYLLLNCPCKTSSPCYTGPCPTTIWFWKCLKVVIYCHWLPWHTEIKRVWGNMFFIKFLAIRMSRINQE